MGTAFAKAVQQIPMIISENAGFDAQEMLGSLKKAHADGRRGEVGVECGHAVVVQRSSHGCPTAGIDVHCVADMIRIASSPRRCALRVRG